VDGDISAEDAEASGRSANATGPQVTLETGTGFRATGSGDLGHARFGRELAVWLLELEPPRPLLLLKELGGPKTPGYRAAAAWAIEGLYQPELRLASISQRRREGPYRLSSILTSIRPGEVASP